MNFIIFVEFTSRKSPDGRFVSLPYEAARGCSVEKSTLG